MVRRPHMPQRAPSGARSTVASPRWAGSPRSRASRTAAVRRVSRATVPSQVRRQPGTAGRTRATALA
ncbi:hypothetical protein [Phytohabitans suffuscus]|uniref:hypothetical protein n=1 Tax=Phytohabitans suffuscus TaxID=624315 RepID=UPI001E5B8C4D|nr:hypothetical protein [Phytohabitans suffuscus]